MKKHILSCTVLCMLATILYTGCKKEDTVPTPGNLSVSPASALPETFVTITGSDMQDIVSIKFDTTAGSFSSVFNTSGALFTTVPTNARYGAQAITLTNKAGQTSTVNFTVLQPAPAISSFTPGNAPPGDTITITGKMLVNINAVYIGSKKAIIIDSSSRFTTKFVIPVGAASGLLSVVTAGGTAYSAGILTVGERAYLIADFDGAGISANGNSRIGERVTLLRHVDREKRHDERAKFVEERAEEKNPHRTRQRPETRQQCWVFSFHGK